MSALIDESLKAQMLVERYRPSVLDYTLDRLDEAQKAIEYAINTTTNLTDKKRLLTIKKSIDEALNTAYSEFNAMLYDDMSQVASIGYDALSVAAATELTASIGLFSDLPQAAVNRILDKNRPILGVTLSEMNTALTASATTRLKKSIAQDLFDGSGIAKGQREARMIASNNEIFARIKRNDLNTVVRTATMQALNEAHYEGYAKLESMGVIVGYRSLATLDSRTSKQCASLDGEFYPLSKYKTIYNIPDRPARHPNCRSRLVPETEDTLDDPAKRPYALTEKSTVNHRDGTKSTKYKVVEAGQVSGKVNFESWFSNQSAKFQKDYLGPSRYELYKNEGVSIKDMYDQVRQKELTLDEIRARI